MYADVAWTEKLLDRGFGFWVSISEEHGYTIFSDIIQSGIDIKINLKKGLYIEKKNA